MSDFQVNNNNIANYQNYAVSEVKANTTKAHETTLNGNAPLSQQSPIMSSSNIGFMPNINASMLDSFVEQGLISPSIKEHYEMNKEVSQNLLKQHADYDQSVIAQSGEQELSASALHSSMQEAEDLIKARNIPASATGNEVLKELD